WTVRWSTRAAEYLPGRRLSSACPSPLHSCWVFWEGPCSSLALRAESFSRLGREGKWSCASYPPEMLLIGNQLVLLSHDYTGGPDGTGPNYSLLVGAINQYMHYLSTNNNAGTDYQLTQLPLTNWPSIH